MTICTDPQTGLYSVMTGLGMHSEGLTRAEAEAIQRDIDADVMRGLKEESARRAEASARIRALDALFAEKAKTDPLYAIAWALTQIAGAVEGAGSAISEGVREIG